MRYFRHLFAVLLLVGLPSPALTKSPAPNLVGTWVSNKDEVAHGSGAVKNNSNSTGTLVVEEQSGAAFRGTMSWASERRGPKLKGTADVQHQETKTIVGIIDWDAVTVYWADQGDNTTYRARLIKKDTMQVIALETGDHAVAGRFIMVRN